MNNAWLVIASTLLAGSVATATAEDKPAKLHQSSPEEMGRCYAASARQAGSEGRIAITATIEPDGSVGAVKLPPGIETWQEETALCVVKLLRFDAAVKDGVATRSQVVIPLNFSLPDEPVVVPPTTQATSSEEISKCYSQTARRAGEEGRLLVTATIEADGSLGQYELPAGVEPWQAETAKCVLGVLKFQPGTVDGVPVAARATFPIIFALIGNPPIQFIKLVSTEAEFDEANRACYPPDLNVSATPKYRTTVSRLGKATKVEVVESSGNKKLDEAGICLLKRLKFQPAMAGDEKIVITSVFPVPLSPPK